MPNASLPIADASGATDTDRRRPGRIDASPALTPMLRAPADFDLTEEDRRFLGLDHEQPGAAVQRGAKDRVAETHGLILASVLSVPVWLIVGVTFYFMLR